MGSFQASILEAFQSLRDELTIKKQAEVDQTSASASKPGPSTSAVNLDLPRPRPRTTSHVDELEVDYLPIFCLKCLVCLWSDFEIGSYSLLFISICVILILILLYAFAFVCLSYWLYLY